MTTGIVADPIYREHDPGPRHPESPRRYDAAVAGVERVERVGNMQLPRIPVRAATEEEILLCHTAGYLETVQRDVASDVQCLSTGDTDLCPRSYEVALMAAGGVLEAVDAVAAGRVRNAFCIVRPPGHHATPDRGMGFCIFNNIAIAARHAQRRHGVGRVLIIDWDVHHGNGTQEIFFEDPDVFFFSTHQWPCYPGTGAAHETGAGAGRGTTLNCPFPPGSGGHEIVGAFRLRLLPAVRRFRPDFVLISAGFDSRHGDPIGAFTLTDDHFRELTEIMLGIANDHAKGRLVSVLEGGYNIEGLGQACGAHVAALARAAAPTAEGNTR